MLILNDLKRNMDLVNSIDWNMTHEEAVRLYLEWGNNWASGNYVIRSKDDVSYYFVVDTWDGNPVIYLIKRNSEDAKELARIDIPEDLVKRYIKKNGNLKGVYAIEGDLKKWLQKELGEI